MMNEHLPHMQYYIRTLHRYMAALEQGDLEAVSAILRRAEQDEALERMIFEINDVFQEKDLITVESEQVLHIHGFLASLSQAEEVKQAPFYEGSHSKITSFLYKGGRTHEERSRMMKTQSNPSQVISESRYNPDKPPTRPRRFAVFMQTLAAVLVVGALLGSFFVLFSSRQLPTKGSGTGSVASQPVIALAMEDGTLSVLRADDGTALWRFTASQAGQTANSYFESPTATIQGQVIYYAAKGQIYALQARNGTLLWHVDLSLAHPGEFDGSSGNIITDGGVVFVSRIDIVNGVQSTVYALRASDGTMIWHYHTGLDQLLSEQNGIVYIASSDSNGSNTTLKALQASNGTLLWSHEISPLSAVVSNDVLYVHAANQKTTVGSNKVEKTLSAFRTKDGNLIWSKQVIDNSTNPIVVEDGMIFLNDGYHFCAYQSSTGSQLWCSQNDLTPLGGGVIAYTATHTTLYASYPTQSSGASKNTFMQVEALNTGNGVLRWSKHLNGANPAALVAMGGIVYTLAGNSIYALNASDGNTLWHSQSSSSFPVSLAVGA
jgi:outer membrane protein assembly factor BamB